MINPEKVKLMTKLAIYEKNDGKRDIPTAKYYKSDYLTLKLINSSIAFTVGFFLLLLLIFVIDAENILSLLLSADLLVVGRNLVIIFVVIFFINLLVTYLIYNYRFKSMREDLQKYNSNLKELMIMYKKEEKGSKNVEYNKDKRTV